MPMVVVLLQSLPLVPNTLKEVGLVHPMTATFQKLQLAVVAGARQGSVLKKKPVMYRSG